jgi:uncharacterized membrane protein (DUF485 family)
MGHSTDGDGVHWGHVAASPEYRELVARRRRFVVPATVFFLSWYLGFILLAGYATGFMGREVVDGLTVGYVLALSQFVMVWGLGWAYLRYSHRVLDPLRKAATAAATSETRMATMRFERVPVGTATTTSAEATS